MRLLAAFAALALSFLAAAQELADPEAERAHVAWSDTVAATLEQGTTREALVAVLFDAAAARRGGRVAQARKRRAWSRAIAGADDPLVHWIAVTNCPFGPTGCERGASLERLVAIDPGNAAVWQVVLNDALARNDAVLARDALARMARAERYDTYHTALMLALDESLARVPMPDALRHFGDEPVDEATARGIAVFGVLLAVAVPDATALVRHCTPGVDPGYETRRADCVATGERIATRSDTTLSRWLGTRVWLRAARGGPAEPRARKAALDHAWQHEQFALTAAEGVEAAAAELERRRRLRSELAAMEAALTAAGIALEAPPGFVPRTPVD